MLSYIASNSTAEIIKNVCKEQNITILNQEVEEIDFFKYIKQTKVNFNLVKYFVIDLKQIKNTEDEIINSIKYFKEMYVNTRLIIIAKGYDNQNIILILIAILFSPMVIGVRFICCKIDKIENRKIKAVIKVIGFVVFSSYLVSLKENVAYLLIGIFSLVYLLYQFYLSGLETK